VRRKFEIIEHRKRRREGADGVLAALEIHAVFHAHACIILREDCRRHSHLTQPAMDERRGQPDAIEHSASRRR
jgi:hypothetical protein